MECGNSADLKEKLLLLLDKYRGLGEIVHLNGTMSIGKIPGKEKWFLCHLYHGLTPEEIQGIEIAIGKSFPQTLRDFYRQFNGMTLFGAGQIELWGQRENARQDMPNYQPISLINGHRNACAMLPSIHENAIFFGGHFGHYFFADSTSGRIYACILTDGKIVAQWDNLELMILDVTKRLSAWFDENAQPVDSAVNERPVLFDKTIPMSPPPTA